MQLDKLVADNAKGTATTSSGGEYHECDASDDALLSFWLLADVYFEYTRKNMRFLNEIYKTEFKKEKPGWTTRNTVELDESTLQLRLFNKKRDTVPTLIVAPYAGHTSTIVDLRNKQSLVEELIKDGIGTLAVTDWKTATNTMKNYSIDDYLSDLDRAVNALGGRVNLIGLCQGGWLSAMYSARFPDKINAIVLAGAPIDTDAGHGAIKTFAHSYPQSFFELLVYACGGLMRGDYILNGFKSMHPYKHYLKKYADLYSHIDDENYLRKFESFERWYEYTINLPGRFYLQAVNELFRENRLFKGTFIGLGKKLDLHDISCPVYLLAGNSDDITPPEQVLNAEKHFGTKKGAIKKMTIDSGHIGLFMGSKALRDAWPKIAKWINKHS